MPAMALLYARVFAHAARLCRTAMVPSHYCDSHGAYPPSSSASLAMLAVRDWPPLTLEIVRRCDRHRFVVLPKRCIVECTIGWSSQNRRLARDFERHCRIACAFVRIAMIRIMFGHRALGPPA